MTDAAVKKRLKIDGSIGEGGGQIIRTALALSILTGTPIEVNNIRAGRAKPGLMRQHLMCVTASKEISNATVTGAHLNSTSLRFEPSEVTAGDYVFDIGSAGSTNLVLQTILPALLFAASANRSNQSSTITIKGGTHNPFAPTADFVQYGFVPALSKLGMQIDYELIKSGYAPIGGGEIRVKIRPYLRRATATPFNLTKRGNLLGIHLVASHLNLDSDICQRELLIATDRLSKLNLDTALITTHIEKQSGIGEGNCCYAIVTHTINDVKTESKNVEAKHIVKKHYNQDSMPVHQEVFTLLGEKHTSSEKVGTRFAGLVKRYLYKTDAVVDEYLTDQLLLPLALSGGGEFSSRLISNHSRTQAWLIQQFLPVNIEFEKFNEHCYRVRVYD